MKAGIRKWCGRAVLTLLALVAVGLYAHANTPAASHPTPAHSTARHH